MNLVSYLESLYPKKVYPCDFSDTKAWCSLCEKISSLYQNFSGLTIKIQKLKKRQRDCTHYISEMPISEEFTRAELLIGNELFMSITPMELQAHINPLKWANGHILIAGLGLGYFSNMVKEKHGVESITVVEKNKEIIEWYERQFHPDHRFIKLICADIFEFTPDQKYDFVYADIWPNFLIEEIEKDMLWIVERIQSKLYAFWGIELYWFDHFKVFGIEMPPLFRSLGFFENEMDPTDLSSEKRSKYKKELEDIKNLVNILTQNNNFVQ